jgi:putative membrane protein
MRILVLCVDRDDDFGVKAGLNSPFIGREQNVEAALALGLKDPEDCDVNTTLAAISIYEEMTKKGVDVEIATICGDVKVGYESDLVLATQLETVLAQIKPDRVILVSDGAEDEFIYPMVFSRVKVDSVRRVWVKQAPTVEGTYYILIKMLQDDKMRKRILTPLGMILAIIGVFALIPKFLELNDTPDQISIIANMTWGMLSLVLGFYVIGYAFKVGERTKNWVGRVGRAVRSGSQMIPFAIIAVIFAFMGIFLGLNNANFDPDADISVKMARFANGVLWMWAFSLISYETGRFINNYLASGRIYWSYLVVSVTMIATGFIVQGSLDVILLFLKQPNVGETLIILEYIAGFLLAAFGSLMNITLRSLAHTSDKTIIDQVESIEYPEA